MTSHKQKNSIPDIKTFGCRLNIWESQVISDHASKNGHSDLIIFNTCAVTSEAERQARQAIRSAKKKRPDAKILVTGCAAQVDPKKWNLMPEVSFVVGNKEKLEATFLAEMLKSADFVLWLLQGCRCRLNAPCGI